MPVRFSQVDKNLLRGGMPLIGEIPMLRDKYGVRKIVSLDGPIGDYIDPICKEHGIEHIIFPLEDGNSELVPKLPEEVKKWAEGGPTYVHCRHGKDRTGMACAMYRVLVNGWDINDAMREAHHFGMGMGLPQDIGNNI